MDDEDEFDNAFSDIDEEAAIAVLNREEQKFSATQRVDHSPPAKRQKTDNRTASINQFSQLPIVLGLDDDYFTRTKAVPLHQRNEEARPPPPHQPAKQKTPPGPVSTHVTHTHNSSVTAPQPLQHSGNPQPPLQGQPLTTSRRPSGPPVNFPQHHVVTDSQRSIHQAKQQYWNASSSSFIATAGMSSSKPHSAGSSKLTTPVQPRQHTAQRQSHSNTTPNPPARNASVGPPNPHLQPPPAQRRPSVTTAYVQPQQEPQIQRHNSLKRQHSSNNAELHIQALRASQGGVDGGGGNSDLRVRLELDILNEQLKQVRAFDASNALNVLD